MTFEWDIEKEKSNIEKHYLDFTLASYVFFDPNRIEIKDTRYDYGEKRVLTIGEIVFNGFNELIIIVVSTKRNNNIRIISARKANKKEKEQYFKIRSST